jgi:hypothetical protein
MRNSHDLLLSINGVFNAYLELGDDGALDDTMEGVEISLLISKIICTYELLLRYLVLDPSCIQCHFNANI